MKTQLQKIIKEVIVKMGISDVVPVVEHTADLSHGDYTTNVAMQLAKVLKRSPVEIAKEIKYKLTADSLQFTAKAVDHFTDRSGQKVSGTGKENSVLQDIDKIEVAPPGFINFYLSASTLSTELSEVLESKEGFGMLYSSVKREAESVKKKIMVEFAHPNTHKAFHIGHLRNITTGEAIIRLLKSQGATVIRANYQGDVGMHIAKALYALLRTHNSQLTTHNLKSLSLNEKVELLGKAYAAGSRAFEEDKEAQARIKDYNFLIYAAAQRFQKERGIEPSSTDYLKFVSGRDAELDEIYELWKETRQWSLDYFDSIYKRVGSHYDRFYFESECLRGVDLAKDAVKKGVLEESEGAIIFNGKKYGLDTRVFVNSLGLPTYEAKELALSQKEFSEFGTLDKVIHVVGPEQASFFQVTFKTEELLGIQKNQQYHLVYGWVKLKQGKMSSRLGNVVLGETLLEEAKKEIVKILNKPSAISLQLSDKKEEIAEKAAIAAVKYAFLKVSTLNTIAFDLKESVNINGDSGPYLMYTYARCKSVMRKAQKPSAISLQPSDKSESREVKADSSFNSEELLVMRLIYRFTENVGTAAKTYSPNILCEYLYDLSSAFNTFSNKHSILGGDMQYVTRDTKIDQKKVSSFKLQVSSQSQFRLTLTTATAQVLKNGLYLLGIETLEKM